MKRENLSQLLKDCLLILAGSVMYGISTVLFIFPHSLLLGGTSGISVILESFLGASPGRILMVINSFLIPWMDFVYASIIMSSGVAADQTVALGLFSMVDKTNRNRYFGQFCAGGVVTSIPISILFIIMQRFYVEGVTAGGTKG